MLVHYLFAQQLQQKPILNSTPACAKFSVRMSGEKIINSEKAPHPIGPYSQAVKAGKLIFCSGQIGVDPKTKKLVKGGIKAETRQALENLKSVLQSAGCAMDDVVKVDIFLVNMDDFAKMNEVYAAYFSKNKPARQTAAVPNLPSKTALVEISCIAYKED